MPTGFGVDDDARGAMLKKSRNKEEKIKGPVCRRKLSNKVDKVVTDRNCWLRDEGGRGGIEKEFGRLSWLR